MPAVLPLGLYNPTNCNVLETSLVQKEAIRDVEAMRHNLRALNFLGQSHVNCSMKLCS